MLALPPISALAPRPKHAKRRAPKCPGVYSTLAGFPSFLPKEIENIKDPFARTFATRIERLPVSVILTHFGCPSAFENSGTNSLDIFANAMWLPIISEWRYTHPLLEEAGLEAWAVDILERLPRCDVTSKREHFYQLWNFYIKKPMILVGPSLGAAVAIDFAVNHPEAVEKLILIDASVYAEGTGSLADLPRVVAYAGVYLLKSIPVRLYANFLTFTGISFSTSLDWTNVGRLHCLLPWWEDATVDFMISGGYNVSSQIKQVNQKTLIIWGENDRIISNKLAVRLHCELPNAIIRQLPECGHLPHVEKPNSVAKLILEYVQEDCYKEMECGRSPTLKLHSQSLHK
ncbi:uncharacterized hydrolase YugF isoform X4 [Carya illinoinensis]|uniref:uncharacterized hydrolase YugF isoform X4 n=1 Tax=Carya illinoinensis TaxID=32201 RepID=UPI001C7209BF|nr:uncharacterized hydrolase YugF isoform X4 [Carya illinoinensis]